MQTLIRLFWLFIFAHAAGVTPVRAAHASRTTCFERYMLEVRDCEARQANWPHVDCQRAYAVGLTACERRRAKRLRRAAQPCESCADH